MHYTALVENTWTDGNFNRRSSVTRVIVWADSPEEAQRRVDAQCDLFNEASADFGSDHMKMCFEIVETFPIENDS